MNDTPPPYPSMVSLRSRRLRTLGLALLAVLLIMSLYGFLVLMPSLHHLGANAAPLSPSLSPEPAGLDRARKMILVRVSFAYAYWGVCALIALALFFVAWLDMREVSQTYLRARRTLWTATTGHTGEEHKPPDESENGTGG